MKFSKYGERFLKNSGILSLMEDMGSAMINKQEDVIMMGGGNPSRIKAFETLIAEKLQCIASNPRQIKKLTGIYNPPTGQKEFAQALATFINLNLGWDINYKNICITHGSQHALFMLFNLFGGLNKKEQTQKILLPLAPEYIGYDGIGFEKDLFISPKPIVELLESPYFKYQINFEALKQLFNNDEEAIGAICLSRPTNPTGNVLSDESLRTLYLYAKEFNIPIILDNAYGLPFPNISFVPHNIFWNENVIVCLSLSKLGLPTTRTGIVIANEQIIEVLARCNAAMALSTGTFGNQLVQHLFEDNSLSRICKNVINPFYCQRKNEVLSYLKLALKGTPALIHVPEGALFIWIWIKGLPISSYELYQHLKEKGVLIVSGHYFFHAMREDWAHANECIRITYTQELIQIKKGIDILAKEIALLYKAD